MFKHNDLMVINHGTVGCGVMENGVSERTGTVTAIFENSMHLTTDNCVLTLGSKKIPDHPFTIRTDTLPKDIGIGDTFSITKKRLCIKRKSILNLKQYAYTDHDMERINRVNAYSERITAFQTKVKRFYCLNLKFMPIYIPCFKIKHIVSQENIGRELQSCRAEAACLVGIKGFFPLLIGEVEIDQILQTIIPSVEKISLSIKNSDWSEFVKSTANIVGVGMGLTPSGDDFLSGVFVALYFYNTTFGKGFTVDKLKNLANSVASKTSLFSATLIKAAANGWVQDVISCWLVSLFQGDSKQVKELTRKILKIGHSSGADILLGLIITLESIFSKNTILKVPSNKRGFRGVLFGYP